MRIYNGTNSHLNLPLTGSQRITVPPHAVSGDILPSTDFLSLMVSSYDFSEIAFIISGPYELNMCANVSGATGFVVNSLEEAVERFCPSEKEEIKVEKKEIITEETQEAQSIEETTPKSVEEEKGEDDVNTTVIPDTSSDCETVENVSDEEVEEEIKNLPPVSSIEVEKEDEAAENIAESDSSAE
jgi:hypothetical protein